MISPILTMRAKVLRVTKAGAKSKKVTAEIAFDLQDSCVPIHLLMDNVPLSILPFKGERLPVKYKIVNHKIVIVGYKRPKTGTEYCAVK